MPHNITTVASKNTRPKRMVRYMTNPGRVLTGAPVALFTAFATNSWHLSWANWGWAYLLWFPIIFVVFWLGELHRWAGGSSYNTD